MVNKALNDYYLGILYGDGYLQDDYYFFSTTRIGLAKIIEEKLESKNIKFRQYVRGYAKQEQENWAELIIFEIMDKEFLNWLELKKIFSENPSERFKLNSNFIRGYLETKGTFFYYKQRNSDMWRVSISGNESDIQYLHDYLVKEIGIKCSAITQRKEREELNVISQSFRFSIQNRKGVETFIDFIDSDCNITSYMKEKFSAFYNWNKAKPFNMIKQYKNPKTATMAMAKELKVTIKGVVGGGYGKFKPVYLWEEEKQIEKFDGWQGAYEWACEKFVQSGLIPPTIAE